MSRSALFPGHQPAGLDDPVNEAAIGDKRAIRTVGGLALAVAALLGLLAYAFWAVNTPSDMGTGSRNTPYLNQPDVKP